MSQDNDLGKLLKEQSILLEQILKWIRIMGSTQAISVVNNVLDNDMKKLAYDLSDGKNTGAIISKHTNIKQPAISSLWKQWLLLGLGDSVTASGGSRFRRAFDLRTMGISVPEIKSGEIELASTHQNSQGELN